MHRARKATLKIIPALALPFLALASLYAQDSKPVITRIDPPNWFTAMPDSLLLIHGEHLDHATFSLRNTSAQIKEANTSPNGHCAFVVLATGNQKPGTFDLVATNSSGSTTAPYTLKGRRGPSNQPKGFGPSDVMYLIMPDRFADGDTANNKVSNFRAPDDRSAARAYHGGDLRGIEDHLDYLQQLGVTTLWTTPLYDNTANQSGQTYHGYSATNLYAVDPHFGTMDDYRTLVHAAHARGMKVILDMVPNHVGPSHPWANDPPTADWLHGSVAHHLSVDTDDFSSITNPAAPPQARRTLLDGWFAGMLPDLNQDNPLVETYLIQNAIWWIESADLDGLRIDTFPYVPRRFWHDYNSTLHTLYPTLTDVGEIFAHDPHTTSFFAGGRANTGSDGTYDTLLDTPFDYPLFFALRNALTNHAPMTAIADVLAEDSLYPHPERLVTFLGNHDNARFLSQSGSGPAALHLAFGLLATLRGTPQLYYGDEIGMTGGNDPDNRKDFPGGFPTDKQNAFTPQGRTPAEQQMHDWVQSLLALRHHHPALQTGKQSILFADKDTLAFVRTSAGGSCIVIASNSTVQRNLTIPIAPGVLNPSAHLAAALPGESPLIVQQGTLQEHLEPRQLTINCTRP